MPRHFKVHEELSEAELEELRTFAREPGRTIDECHEWLQSRGFTMHRSAVGTWKKSFDAELLKERMSSSGELARAIKEGVQEGKFDDVSDAAAVQISQLIFEATLRADSDGSIPPLELARMAMALRTNVSGKRAIEKLREEMAAKQKLAVDEAAKLAHEGGSGEAVVDKVRAILGIQ